MKVINFFGGPGIGKSTISAEMFVFLKKQHLNVELVTEYAKDMVYEQRPNILNDQLYLLAKQNRRLEKLLPHGLDYAITDSPLLLNIIYYIKNGGSSSNFILLVEEIFKSYDNVNFLLERNLNLTYNGVGRVQKSLQEALVIDNQIQDLLLKLEVPHIPVSVSRLNCELINNML